METAHAQRERCESAVRPSWQLKLARLRKEPGLYFNNISTSPCTVIGAFPSARLLTTTYARRPAPTVGTCCKEGCRGSGVP